MKKIIYMLMFNIMLSYYRESNSLGTFILFILLGSIFSFSIGNNMETNIDAGIGFLWTNTMIVCLLSFERWMSVDHSNGVLELYKYHSFSIRAMIIIKLISQWLLVFIPIILGSIILLVISGISIINFLIFIKCMVFFTLTVICLGFIISSITLELKHKSIIISLLLIPMYLPVLIFSVACTKSDTNLINHNYIINILLSITIFAIIMVICLGPNLLNKN